jgi:hypothetical protein
MREKENMSVVDDRTCEDISTNVMLSSSVVVGSEMQVAFEERELNVQQPASREEVTVVPSTLEDVTMHSAILKLQPAVTTEFCESTSLLVPSLDLTCTYTSTPCDELQISNFDHVVLITHKEVLARIPPDDIVSYIMLNERINLRCAMDKISEISHVNSSIYAFSFMFHFIGDYSMDEKFQMDHICITCC